MHVHYDLTIADDQLTAFLTVREAFSGQGLPLTEAVLRNVLAEYGIVFGILESGVQQILQQGFGHQVLIARGIAPLRGADAYFESLVVSRQQKYYELCERFCSLDEVSTADFRPLMVHARRPVLRKHQATRGAPGLSVTGNILPGTYGENCEPPAMENLISSQQDKNLWLSACKGICLFDLPHFIEVRPILLLERNLTESLAFDGIVAVFGHVSDMVRLRASDDVFITQVVEGAVILSQGNIFLQQGVKGKHNAVLRSSGNIQLVFAEHATLEVGAELQAESLSLCHTYTLGNCHVDYILGGQTLSAQNIVVKSLGSRGVSTDVAAGYADYLQDTLQQIESELEQLQSRLSEIEENLADPVFLIDKKKQILRQHYYYQQPCLTYAYQKKSQHYDYLKALHQQQANACIQVQQEVMADTLVEVARFEHYQEKYHRGALTYRAGRYGVLVSEASARESEGVNS